MEMLARPSSVRMPLLTTLTVVGATVPAMERPRREAAMRRRSYAFGDDDDEQEEEAQKAEISTPGEEECQTPQTVPDTKHPAAHHSSFGKPKATGFAAMECHKAGAAAVPPNEETQAPLDRDMWGEPQASHDQENGQLQADMHYRSDADAEEDADHLMLGGIYGHMNYAADGDAAAMSSHDVCGNATEEMILDEMNLGSAELDEARWLRKTYETVYNPAARSRALQALTGDSKLRTSPLVTKLDYERGNDMSCTKSWQQGCGGGDAAWKQHTSLSAMAPMLDSDFGSYFLPPQQPKSMWTEGPRKCTVMYDYV
jgi:hypothetical protein